MDPTAQRIAIANACGLKDVRMSWHWQHGDRLVHGNDTLVPNYLNDLNAMHEVEKILTFHQETEYIANLMRQHKDYPMTKGFLATAAQRAEAFLRTLNLWTA